MAFPAQFLDELRARLRVTEVVGRKVKLTRKGRENWGLCPFHKEKTPSFSVSDEKGFYHCFSCGAHGSAIDFVMNTESLNFPEAVEKLAGEVGLEVPQDSPEERERTRERQTLHEVVEKACQFFERSLRMPEGRAGLDYLRRRGLDDDTVARFRLGFAPDSRSALKAALGRDGVAEDQMVAAGLVIRPEEGERAPYDRFRGRVMFPITDRRGQVIAFGGRVLGPGEPKYLNSPESALFHKGRTLYGLAQALPAIRKAGTILVTEGYMDVIALARAGFEHAVAPLGTALTEDQIQELWRLAPDPILCFDGDAAGQKAAARAALRSLPILKAGVSLRFAVLSGGEDPDSLIAKEGPVAMEKILATAQPLSEVLWRMESGGHVPAAPEQRAALQKRLEDLARQIPEPTVRAHFLRAFKDRLWQRPAARKGGRGPGPAVLDGRAGPAAPIDGLHQAERVLLAIAINHPDRFVHLEDSLGVAHFGEPAMDRLRQDLVVLLGEEGDWTPETVKEELARRGQEDSLHLLFHDPLIRRHRFVRPDALPEDVHVAWQDNLDLLRKAAHRAELKEADADDGDYSDEALARRLALVRARLGEE
ncbi:MAG: DNA primase [Magnetospirillum sp. WYHS-4]